MDTFPIQLEHVRFSYHANETVVDDVTVNLEAGAMTAIVGPNAAGKSTLLKLMLGHLELAQGRVLIDGRDVCQLSAEQRATQFSYVPQRPARLVAFTVRQIVELGRHAVGPSEQGIDEALAQCDLSELASRAYMDLSVGQQQRVALARAIAQMWNVETAGMSGQTVAGNQPDSSQSSRSMLLDEPVSAMDLKHIHQSMGVLRDLADSGLSVAIVLHDLNLASLYADQVWLMDQGKLVVAGSRAEVLKREVLEPVYGVKLNTFADTDSGRQVFQVDLSATMKS